MIKCLRALSVLFLSLCLLFSLFACTPEPAASASYTWSLTELEGDVEIHTDLQLQYLLDDYDSIGKYADGKRELSRPLPTRFTWSASPDTESEPAIVSYTLEIATESDFSDSVKYTTSEAYMDVYNLLIGTNYLWRVSATLADGQTVTSQSSAFSTASVGPRNLYIDGITNARDLGGWVTEDGYVTSQGKIFRAGRLNKSESSEVIIEITEDGILALRDTLGVKTEIDIRRTDNNEVGAITASPLGGGVRYYSLPMDWEVGNILTDNIDTVKQIFAVLGDESNYPLVFHCNIGTDRTGLLAFLINGLAGVPEEDLYRDYLFSNFGNIGGSRSLSGIQKSYVSTVKSYEGDSLSEQIQACLIDLGVEKSDIDTVIRVMTSD